MPLVALLRAALAVPAWCRTLHPGLDDAYRATLAAVTARSVWMDSAELDAARKALLEGQANVGGTGGRLQAGGTLAGQAEGGGTARSQQADWLLEEQAHAGGTGGRRRVRGTLAGPAERGGIGSSHQADWVLAGQADVSGRGGRQVSDRTLAGHTDGSSSSQLRSLRSASPAGRTSSGQGRAAWAMALAAITSAQQRNLGLEGPTLGVGTGGGAALCQPAAPEHQQPTSLSFTSGDGDPAAALAASAADRRWSHLSHLVPEATDLVNSGHDQEMLEAKLAQVYEVGPWCTIMMGKVWGKGLFRLDWVVHA